MDFIKDFIGYPFKQFKNGGNDGLNFLIWVGLAILIVWILTSYGIVPACPKIGGKKQEAIEAQAE